MFKNLGKLETKHQALKVKIPISSLKEDINFFDNCIVVKKGKNINIYDRICDHAGGKLINKNNKIICPMHNWEFKPLDGKYTNQTTKKKISYEIKKDNLEFDLGKEIPHIKKLNNTDNSSLKLRYFNHAFLIFEGQKFKFGTDPWAIGPAFASGWWLDKATPSDWLDELNSCDFIYISHNHPDHLNFPTLKLCNKNIPLVTPNYNQKSTLKLLDDLSFKNIFEFDFNQNINFENSDLIFSFLKSGDFRDDSGIYFSINNFSCLADVDTNYINFGNFPVVDLYCSSFAGGATAYPLMFDNFNFKDKQIKQKIDTRFLLNEKRKYLKSTRAKYFLPYAGSFSTDLKRDKFVKENIVKNTVNDYEKLINSEIKILNFNKNNFFHFKNKKLIKEKMVKISKSLDFNKTQFIKDFKRNNKIDSEYIKNYFINSNFNDNLNIKLELVDDEFNKIFKTFYINFNNRIKISEEEINDPKSRFLNLKIRYDSFMHVIKNMQPWEDLLIGFQCKVFRQPNVYNVKFWNHFTNIYISKKYTRETLNCKNCEVIDNHVDNLIFNQKNNHFS